MEETVPGLLAGNPLLERWGPCTGNPGPLTLHPRQRHSSFRSVSAAPQLRCPSVFRSSDQPRDPFVVPFAPHSPRHQTARNLSKWISAAPPSSFSKPLLTRTRCATSSVVSVSQALCSLCDPQHQVHPSQRTRPLTILLPQFRNPPHHLLPPLLPLHHPANPRRPRARARLHPRSRDRDPHRPARRRPRAPARIRAPPASQPDL